MICWIAWILWLFNRSLSIQGQTDFSVPEKQTTWSDAVQQCQLATPELNFKNGVLTANIDFEIKEDVWLGYFSEATVFQYIGCQNITDPPSAITIENQNSPGNCMSLCDGTNVVQIGLSENECYCFEAALIPDQQKCDRECKGQNGTACGGLGGQISLYQAFEGNTSSIQGSSESGDCVQAGKAGEVVDTNWSKCDGDVLAFCSNNTVTVVLRTGESSDYTSWYLSANKCFTKQFFLASLHNVNTYNNEGQAWIDLMRSPVIYNYYRNEKTFDEEVKTKYTCMYLSAGKNVNFGSSTETKKYLCTNDSGETSTKHRTSEAQGTDVGAAVGGPVTLLVIAVIVVVVIIFLKKRNIICANRSEKAENSFGQGLQEQSEYSVISDSALTNCGPAFGSSQKHINFENTNHAPKQENVKRPDLRPQFTYDQPDFDDLSKNKTDGASNDLDPGHYAHTYFVLDKEGDENDAYSVTGDHNLATNQGSDNVYNKLEDKSNSTYDHVRKPEPVTALRDFKGENDYDFKGSTIKAVVSSTAGESKDSKNFSKVEEDDTYNHTRVKAAKPTDNVYGVPDI